MEGDSLQAPNTHMSGEDADGLVRLLRALPANTGFMISHCMEPSHTPGVFGGYAAIVVLPGTGARGDGSGNNPARALQDAWANAHLDAYEKLGGLREK